MRLASLAGMLLALTAARADTGTAFVVHPDGWMLTCAHVVDRAERVTVRLGEATWPAEVRVCDTASDVALIKVAATGLPALPLGNSDDAVPGTEVTTFGFPLIGQLGATMKITRGAVSGIAQRGGQPVLQVDAAINPGGSGGPLVDSRGVVLGIVSAKLLENHATAVGFAVPIKAALPFLGQQQVQPAEPGDAAVLDGPGLYRRVSPAVALVDVARQAPAVEPSAGLGRTLSGHRAGLTAVASAPDGSWLVTGSHDHTARVWNAADGAERLVLRGHQGCVHAVAVAPSGELIATGGPDQTVRLWRADNGQPVRTMTGHKASVERLAFSPDGAWLASLSTAPEDPVARVWNVATGELAKSFQGSGERLADALWSADSRRLTVIGGDPVARVWTVVEG